MRNTLAIAALLALGACGGGGAGGNAAAPTEQGEYGSSSQGCRRFLQAGRPPAIANEATRAQTKVVCNVSFVSLYSGVVRSPLWVAEYINEGTVRLGRQVERIDDFHEDDRLPAGRPTLADYRGSGWDRGHLAPDADMPSREATREAMALGVNIAPQNPRLNRNSWADLERSVRRQTRGGPVYVVTGTLYRGRLQATRDDGRVKVPTQWWKAAYAVDRGAAVFIAENIGRPRWQDLSVDQFTAVYGVDPFPGLDPRFRRVNGARDGSMDGAAGAGAGKGGAAGAGGANGAGAAGTGRKPIHPDDRLVHDPANGQWITRGDFRRKYKYESQER